MKAYIAEQLNAGKKYNEILEEVKREMLADLIESHSQMSSLIVADAILAAGFSLGAK